MSGYLEANREEYQERLRAVSRDGNWTGWCAFFLQGIIQQSAENEHKARAILSLYNGIMDQVVNLSHSPHAVRAVDFIFQMPIFSAPVFESGAGIPKPSANRIMNILRDEGLLITLREGKGRRAGVYAFTELLNITEGGNIFEAHR